MFDVLESSLTLLVDLYELVFSVGLLLLPWLGLVAWLAFWLLAVNWTKFRPLLVEQGGWIGLLLMGLVWILIWGVVAPPASGSYHLFNLTLSNFVGKTVYVTSLLCVMLLAGGAQLSGMCEGWLNFPPDVVDEPHAHGHESHGHDSHGHDTPAVADSHGGHH